jgi:adenine-specific DNA-methyltransferase
MAKKNPNTPPQQANTYTHPQEAVQRPDVGVQPEFTERKGAKTYRYDSSLAPELCWDENAERELAEWLLERIAEAAEQGEQASSRSRGAGKAATRLSPPSPSASPA